MGRGFSLSLSSFFLSKNILSTYSAFSEIKLGPKIGGLGFEQVFIIESKTLEKSWAPVLHRGRLIPSPGQVAACGARGRCHTGLVAAKPWRPLVIRKLGLGCKNRGAIFFFKRLAADCFFFNLWTLGQLVACLVLCTPEVACWRQARGRWCLVLLYQNPTLFILRCKLLALKLTGYKGAGVELKPLRDPRGPTSTGPGSVNTQSLQDGSPV